MRVRLVGAEAGGRSLDAAIGELLGLAYPGALTTNLDDALDLIQAVLPGWSVDIQGNRHPHPRDLKERPGRGPYFHVATSAPLNARSHSAGFVAVTVPVEGATRALSAMCALFAALASDRVDIAGFHPADGSLEGVTARTVTNKLLRLPGHVRRQVIDGLSLVREPGDCEAVLEAVRGAQAEGRLRELDKGVDEVSPA